MCPVPLCVCVYPHAPPIAPPILSLLQTYHLAMSPYLPPEDNELLFYLPQQLLGPHRKLLAGFTQCSQNPSLDVAQHFLNEVC